MKSKLAHHWELLQPSSRFLILAILIIGIFFRFVNLDRKVYWQDEASTSLRISGYSKSEFYHTAFNGQVIRVADLHQNYQSPNPDKTLGDAFNTLMDKSEHTPFYYLMARFWAQLLGGSVAVMRTLPAILSLFAFPAVYWLCLELFESSFVGWMAVALIAVSPIHILYAQEAREYSLWTVSILISSAALLQAIRRKTNLSWGIYAASLAIALYSYLLSGLVAIAHALYIVVTEGFKFNKTTIAYLGASVAALLTFIPWLWVLFFYSPRLKSFTDALEDKLSISSLLGKWFRNVNRVFHDADLGSLNIILVVFALYSFYFLVRHTPKKVWLFLLGLFGVTALTLALPDLIWGGQRSVITRYLIPCALSIELAVAYLLTAQITNARKIWQQQLWRVVAIALISMGIVSAIISSHAETWWNKNDDVTKHYPKISRIINKPENPIVISDGGETDVLSLSHLLDPQIHMLLVVPPTVPQIPNGFSEVFLFDVSAQLLHEFQSNQYNLEPIVDKKRANLWKITP